MVLAPATDDQLATARKMASTVDGASEQGPAADPEFMQTRTTPVVPTHGP